MNDNVRPTILIENPYNSETMCNVSQYSVSMSQQPPEKLIWITFQKEGVHLYPAAATDPKLKTGDWDDVSFLGVAHRHIFHFKVQIEVMHDDRDIEFIQFKRWCERLYATDILELNHKSCEMIADDLAAQILNKYPNRKLIIDVSEDGENGASLTIHKSVPFTGR